MEMIQQLKGVMNQIQMAQNPQLMLHQFLMSNPQLKNIFELIKNGGGDLQTTFMNLAKQRNIDPQMILNLLRQ